MTAINHGYFASFAEQFNRHADKPCLISADNHVYSYADINQQSARLANYLSALGLVKGQRVSVQASKSPQLVCLYLACLRSGLVFHPLNTAYTPNELDFFLHDAEPSMLVCDAAQLSALKPRPNIHSLDGSGGLVAAAQDYAPHFNDVVCASDDLAALLYSSGTTGVPKGVMLTQQNLSTNTRVLVEAWGFSERDRLLHALPIFHVHGLFVALGCVLASGASMRWLATFDCDAVFAHLGECSVFMGVPSYYTRLLGDARLSQHSTQSMRLFISGSAPLRTTTFKQFADKTGHTILERYGMTETNMTCSNPLIGERIAGTVGKALPGVQVRIMVKQQIAAVGQIGDLQVRGENVFKGYWKQPEKTAQDFTADGFFITGDLAKIDHAAYVSIVGRTKDLIITGGLNVYPKEVENVIDTMAGVQECAVIGVPHDDFGEAVVAVIVPDGASAIKQQDIIANCKTQLANFKVPKKVLLAPELPRNALGKVQKNVLRETYA